MSTYRERLWPSPWAIVSFFPLVPALVLISAPFNIWLGIAVSVALYAAIVTAMIARSPRIEVIPSSLIYGNALLETEFIGAVSAFTGDAARAQRGVNLDARAWTKFRAFTDGVVRIELIDPEDPTPYWLVSSRDPIALTAALRAVRITG